jgi:hypothetical protein
VRITQRLKHNLNNGNRKRLAELGNQNSGRNMETTNPGFSTTSFGSLREKKKREIHYISAPFQIG